MKWAASVEAWQALKSGEGCAMCADIHLAANPHSFLVAELPQSVVRLPRNQYMYGWTVVASKRHVSELWELSDQELVAFWQDVTRVAHALDTLFQPAKINYGVFGNLCPHLHCHVLPRSYTDDPHQPIDMHEQQRLLSDKAYRVLIEDLRRLILGGSLKQEPREANGRIP